MRDLGLDGIQVKALDCPSGKVGMQEAQRRADELAFEPAESTRYRPGVMRIAYLSLDRPDLAHAVKCLSRHMQQPTQTNNLADLKKVELWQHSLAHTVSELRATCKPRLACPQAKLSATGLSRLWQCDVR
eukprot:2918470-Amphidinium_carterae.1